MCYIFVMNVHDENTHWLEKCPGYKLGYKIIAHDKHLPVIVLVHGLASNHTRWSEFITNTTLLDHFNIIRVDIMGHGLSLQRRRVTRQDWCDDIAVVLKQEGFSKAIIIGHSLGAQVAIQFAHSYPSLCIGTILIDVTFPQLLHGTLSWVKKLKYVVWSIMWLAFGVNKLGIRRKNFKLQDLYELDKQTRIKLAANQSIASLYINPLADLRHIPLALYLQDMFELVRPLPSLEAVTAKVLAIVSSGTQLIDRKKTLQQIQRFSNGEVKSIEADHWPLTENPEQTRKLIEKWCEQLIDE